MPKISVIALQSCEYAFMTLPGACLVTPAGVFAMWPSLLRQMRRGRGASVDVLLRLGVVRAQPLSRRCRESRNPEAFVTVSYRL
jgi:hypothetical protein